MQEGLRDLVYVCVVYVWDKGWLRFDLMITMISGVTSDFPF